MLIQVHNYKYKLYGLRPVNLFLYDFTLLFTGNANVNGTYSYNVATGTYNFYLVVFYNGYNKSSEIVLYNTDSRLTSIATTAYYTTCHATFTSTNFKLSEITSVGYTGFAVTNVYGIRKN